MLAAALAVSGGCVVAPPETAPRGEPSAGPGPTISLRSPWTGWDDAVAPADGLQRVLGWTVNGPDAATFEFSRAATPFSAGRPAARLTSGATGSVDLVVLSPGRPIALRDPFDSIELWIGANPVNQDGFLAGSPARVSARIRDAAQTPFTIPLGAFPRGRWMPVHVKIPADTARDLILPAQFEAIEIFGWTSPVDDELWLSTFSVYLEHVAPIVPEWRRPDWRKRYQPPLSRILQSPPDGRPEDAQSEQPGRLVHIGPDAYEFHASVSGETVVFRMNAAEWHRGGEILWEGRPCGRWDGWTLEDDGFDPAPRLILALADTLRIECAGGLSVVLRVNGMTLHADFESSSRSARAIRAGRIRTSGGVHAIQLPFLQGPRLLMLRCSDTVATPVAAMAMFDPYRSAASRISFGDPDKSGDCGAALYEPATDGVRNAIRERYSLSVSSRIREVLPRVPFENGPALRTRDPQARVAATDLEAVDPNPPCPADEIDCLDPRWSRDLLRRSQSGAWIAGSTPGVFAVKTPFLDTLARTHPDTESSEADPRPAALDLTRRPPWSMTDFDARTHGAATFDAAWSGVAAWLRGAARDAGVPVLADADYAWLYAGDVDAYLARGAFGAALLRESWLPIFPLFQLNAILPGVGPAWIEPDPPDGGAPSPDIQRNQAAHRYIATLIAYGLAPRLDGPAAASAAAVRIRHLSGAMHGRQRLNPVERLAFSDGRSLVSAVDALASGLWRMSRLYLRHADGLEIWVNGSREPWEIIIGAGPVVLPPHGWYAAEEDFLCASTRVDGGRADRIRSAGFAYHDGHGGTAFADGMACPLPVVLRDEPHGLNRKFTIEFPLGAARLGLAPPLFPVGARTLRIAAQTAARSLAKAPAADMEDGRLWILPSPDSRFVEVEWTK